MIYSNNINIIYDNKNKACISLISFQHEGTFSENFSHLISVDYVPPEMWRNFEF